MLLRLILLVNSALGLTVLSSLDFWLLSMLFPSPKFIYAISTKHSESSEERGTDSFSPAMLLVRYVCFSAQILRRWFLYGNQQGGY